MMEAAYRLMNEYEDFYRRKRPNEDLLFHVRLLIGEPNLEFAIETLSDLLWNSIMFARVWDEISFNI